MILSIVSNISNEKITSLGYIFLYGIEKACLFSAEEYFKHIGLKESSDTLLPKAGNNRGHKPSHKILSLISSIMVSGERIYFNIDCFKKKRYY
jgi:hypothetical protein